MTKGRQSLNELSATEQSAIKQAEKREDTRSKISLVFILGYLLVITLLILLSALGKLTSDVAKDFLLAIGSPLGFIIGYYFKSASQE